ncbi:hypothetical protein FC093_01715 [Ilyomonas limi]|uniref:Uncharacterized protein n=1 Tax=Ilyomonas limi TaxID=2575867 RepID=A0A4U3L8T6_9BACT|nr:hypothetical protein [Ilyomonas limi]TKK71765.1 hypothetical protein FC093_01715 [Ilyomonas limi]
MQSVNKTIALTFILSIVVCRLCIAQVVISTAAVPPVNPYINQALSTTSSGIHVAITSTETIHVFLYGSLERLLPDPFKIELDSAAQILPGVNLVTGVTKFLDVNLLEEAFANFNDGNLNFTGKINSLADLQEGPNYKLPEGYYKICFFAKSDDGRTVSNLSCAFFYICSVTAPQFTQPVNNLVANPSITIVQPTSPVIFSWLPPQSSCGLQAGMFNYNFELREILDGQTITDALNNPYVFRKTGLTSSIFSLDTNLYQHVLEFGKKYIMQVAATAIGNLQGTIENNGYSRVEAFQYGGSSNFIAGAYDIPPPDTFYIPSFEERKTDFWDDMLSAGKDTLVPIEEYIAFALMEKGVAYNLDAIELFLSMNPELANQKAVKLGYIAKFPDFPTTSAAEMEKFNIEHRRDLEPDSAQFIKFNQYLNELTGLTQQLPANAVEPINELINYLNTLKGQTNAYSGTLLGYINEVLSELLYDARNYSRTLNTAEINKLQSLVSIVKDLSVESPSDNSFLNHFPLENNLQVSNERTTHSLFHNAGYIYRDNNTIYQQVAEKENFFQGGGQLVTFGVSLWRSSKEQPYKPVTNTPDLMETYRISYILSELYNHKNPEIGSHSSSDLASTIQCLLPGNAKFKFWARNALNGKLTNPQDVDLRDVYNNFKKKGSNSNNPFIVLKVE